MSGTFSPPNSFVTRGYAPDGAMLAADTAGKIAGALVEAFMYDPKADPRRAQARYTNALAADVEGSREGLKAISEVMQEAVLNPAKLQSVLQSAIRTGAQYGVDPKKLGDYMLGLAGAVGGTHKQMLPLHAMRGGGPVGPDASFTQERQDFVHKRDAGVRYGLQASANSAAMDRTKYEMRNRPIDAAPGHVVEPGPDTGRSNVQGLPTRDTTIAGLIADIAAGRPITPGAQDVVDGTTGQLRGSAGHNAPENEKRKAETEFLRLGLIDRALGISRGADGEHAGGPELDGSDRSSLLAQVSRYIGQGMSDAEAVDYAIKNNTMLESTKMGFGSGKVRFKPGAGSSSGADKSGAGAAGAAPPVGTVSRGTDGRVYRFKGGDHRDKANWEPTS